VIAYPTIPQARIRQEVVVDHDGGPYLTWASTMWLMADADVGTDADADQDADVDGPVWATETGYWRLPPERPEGLAADQRVVELLLADPAGHLALYAGTAGNGRIDLASDLITRTPDAAELTAATRMFGLVRGELMWVWDIAAFGQPLQSYASAQLGRV
jgi:THAP4-like, heme-binding beta-barrel domain